MKKSIEYRKLLKTGTYRVITPGRKYLKTFLGIFLPIILILFFQKSCNQFISDYVQKEYIDILQVKRQAVEKFQATTGKATEIGVSYFSLFFGIVLEDIRISEEEDFSNNKVLFSSQRMEIKTKSLTSENKIFTKVVFKNARLRMDISSNYRQKFFSYLSELHIPEIEFQDLHVEMVRKNQALFQTDRPLNMNVLVRKDFLHIQFDDSRFFLPVTTRIKGTFDLYKQQNKQSPFSLELNEYPLYTFPGLGQKVFYITPETGFGLGKIDGNFDKSSFSLRGDVFVRELSGKFIFSPIHFEDLQLKSNFQYSSNKLDEKKEIFSYHKKLYSNRFTIREQISNNEENLFSYTLDTDIKNLKDLTSKIKNSKHIQSISGSMSSHIQLKETTNHNHWIELDGKLQLNQFHLDFLKPKFNIHWNQLSLTFRDKNQYSLSSSGKLFDKPFQVSSKGGLIFKNRKSKYPLISNIELNGSFDNMNFLDFRYIFNHFLHKFQSALKERQSKLLPETYFVTTDIYKLFLEGNHLQANLIFNQLYTNPKAKSFGNYILKAKNKNSIFELKIESKEKQNDNFLKFRADYARRSPYLDIRTAWNQIPWQMKMLRFCDIHLHSQKVSGELSFTTLGNNLSEMMTHRNINGKLSFNGSKLQPIKDFNGLFRINDYLKKDNIFDIEVDFRLYSHDTYIRSIDIHGNHVKLKGYANIKNHNLVYHLYGVRNQNKPIKFSFAKQGNNCYIHE